MGSAGFFSRRASVIGMLLGSSLASGPLHAAVGASAGAGSVSVNGTPRYSMPIQPTEGIGAMTPRLSIEYVGPGRRTILGEGHQSCLEGSRRSLSGVQEFQGLIPSFAKNPDAWHRFDRRSEVRPRGASAGGGIQNQDVRLSVQYGWRHA